MPVEPVLAQFFTVIGRDDHQRVGQPPALLQIVEELAKLLVQVGDAVVVGVEDELNFLGRQLRLVLDEPSIQVLQVGGRTGPAG